MMGTFSLLALLTIVSPVLAQTQQPNSCGQIVPQNPSPAGYRCGVAIIPAGKYAQRALLSTTTGGSETDCWEACFENTACKALNFASDPTGGSDTTCKIYSAGIGNKNAMRSQDAPGTLFYNKHCLFRAECFDLQINDPTGQFDGKFVTIDNDGNGNHAIFTSSNQEDPGIKFYIQPDGKDTLYNDELGFQARQVTVSGGFQTVYFPQDSLANNGDFTPVSCQVDQQTAALTCSSSLGSVFWACVDNDSANQPDSYGTGLAIGREGAPPVLNKFMTCVPVTLTAQSL